MYVSYTSTVGEYSLYRTMYGLHKLEYKGVLEENVS